MTIIGIDVSKRELVCARITGQGVEKEAWKVPNTEKDIAAWLDGLAAEHRKLLLGSESTGPYHALLAKLCLKKDILFRLLNPIVTKQFTKATVRGKKTDPADALVIARCLLQGESYPVTEGLFNEARPLLRTAGNFSQMLRAVELIRRHYTDHASQETERPSRK